MILMMMVMMQPTPHVFSFLEERSLGPGNGRPADVTALDFSENLRPDNEKEQQARSKKGSVGWDVIVGEYWVNHGILMADNSDYSD